MVKCRGGVHTHEAAYTLAEAGALEGLAEVGAFHFHDAAHFVKAGAHALSDAVTEGFAANCPLSAGKICSACCLTRRLIRIVSRDDGGAVVVVARVQDKTDGIPDPFRRLDRAKFIEHQDFGIEDGTKDVQL